MIDLSSAIYNFTQMAGGTNPASSYYAGLLISIDNFQKAKDQGDKTKEKEALKDIISFTEQLGGFIADLQVNSKAVESKLTAFKTATEHQDLDLQTNDGKVKDMLKKSGGDIEHLEGEIKELQKTLKSEQEEYHHGQLISLADIFQIHAYKDSWRRCHSRFHDSSLRLVVSWFPPFVSQQVLIIPIPYWLWSQHHIRPHRRDFSRFHLWLESYSDEEGYRSNRERDRHRPKKVKGGANCQHRLAAHGGKPWYLPPQVCLSVQYIKTLLRLSQFSFFFLDRRRTPSQTCTTRHRHIGENEFRLVYHPRWFGWTCWTGKISPGENSNRDCWESSHL